MALVPEEGAVRVAGLDILQVMEVVHARPGQVERRDDPVQPADGVQLVSVEKGALCGAVSVGGRAPCPSCPSCSIWHVPSGMPLLAWNRCRNNPRRHRAIRSWMRWQSRAVDLRRSLYRLRDRRRGISRRYSSSLENNRDSLSMPRASAAKPRATTFRSENQGTTSGRGTLPFSLAFADVFKIQDSNRV